MSIPPSRHHPLYSVLRALWRHPGDRGVAQQAVRDFVPSGSQQSRYVLVDGNQEVRRWTARQRGLGRDVFSVALPDDPSREAHLATTLPGQHKLLELLLQYQFERDRGVPLPVPGHLEINGEVIGQQTQEADISARLARVFGIRIPLQAFLRSLYIDVRGVHLSSLRIFRMRADGEVRIKGRFGEDRRPIVAVDLVIPPPPSSLTESWEAWGSGFDFFTNQGLAELSGSAAYKGLFILLGRMLGVDSFRVEPLEGGSLTFGQIGFNDDDCFNLRPGSLSWEVLFRYPDLLDRLNQRTRHEFFRDGVSVDKWDKMVREGQMNSWMAERMGNWCATLIFALDILNRQPLSDGERLQKQRDLLKQYSKKIQWVQDVVMELESQGIMLSIFSDSLQGVIRRVLLLASLDPRMKVFLPESADCPVR